MADFNVHRMRARTYWPDTPDIFGNKKKTTDTSEFAKVDPLKAKMDLMKTAMSFGKAMDQSNPQHVSLFEQLTQLAGQPQVTKVNPQTAIFDQPSGGPQTPPGQPWGQQFDPAATLRMLTERFHSEHPQEFGPKNVAEGGAIVTPGVGPSGSTVFTEQYKNPKTFAPGTGDKYLPLGDKWVKTGPETPTGTEFPVAQEQWGKPYMDAHGNLVQDEAGGKKSQKVLVSVNQFAAAAKSAQGKDADKIPDSVYNAAARQAARDVENAEKNSEIGRETSLLPTWLGGKPNETPEEYTERKRTMVAQRTQELVDTWRIQHGFGAAPRDTGGVESGGVPEPAQPRTLEDIFKSVNEE